MKIGFLHETVNPSSDLILLACSTMLAKINISKCLINIGEAKIAAHSSLLKFAPVAYGLRSFAIGADIGWRISRAESCRGRVCDQA